MVSVILSLAKSSDIVEDDHACTLPDGYRPPVDTTAIMAASLGGAHGYAYVDVSSSGAVKLIMIIWPPGQQGVSARAIAGCFSFPV